MILCDTMEIDSIVESYTDSEMEQFGHDVSDTFQFASFLILNVNGNAAKHEALESVNLVLGKFYFLRKLA